jgi:hypothetical protein
MEPTNINIILEQDQKDEDIISEDRRVNLKKFSRAEREILKQYETR